MSWSLVLLLSGGSYLLKAAGLLLLGDREIPPRAVAVLALFPPALFAALVVVQTVGGEPTLQVDARVIGLLVAAAAVWCRAPFLVVVVSAVLATAAVRALA